jgi:hypothetical protein
MRRSLVAIAATTAVIAATALPALAYWPVLAQTPMGLDAATLAPPTPPSRPPPPTSRWRCLLRRPGPRPARTS